MLVRHGPHYGFPTRYSVILDTGVYIYIYAYIYTYIQ